MKTTITIDDQYVRELVALAIGRHFGIPPIDPARLQEDHCGGFTAELKPEDFSQRGQQ